MTDLLEVGKTGELEDGTMRQIVAEGHEILLARVGDRYYAADNRCPHMGGVLSRGTLVGTIVTCPRHGSQFDLSSGEVVRWLKGSGPISAVGRALKSPKALTTHDVKIEDDRILLEI